MATDKYKGIIAAAIKCFLFALSLIYGLIVNALVFVNGLRRRRLDCRVVSVGNITLGGTGKTTLVEYIAVYLKSKGHKIAVLSRGYKRKAGLKSFGPNSPQAMGDEAYMLSKKLSGIPVLVDTDRIRSANAAIGDYGADTVILDDGFQQWRINKDLEVVTINAANPFGNGCLIPRGILREGLSALKRADIFVLAKTNLSTEQGLAEKALKKYNPRALIVKSIHQAEGFYDIKNPQKILSKDALKGQTVALFCGIGDPGSFEGLIVGLGIRIGLSFRFPDHHAYTAQDLEKIIHDCGTKNINTVITTDKDASRCDFALFATYLVSVLVLRIRLEITENADGFHNRLLDLYSL